MSSCPETLPPSSLRTRRLWHRMPRAQGRRVSPGKSGRHVRPAPQTPSAPSAQHIPRLGPRMFRPQMPPQANRIRPPTLRRRPARRFALPCLLKLKTLAYPKSAPKAKEALFLGGRSASARFARLFFLGATRRHMLQAGSCHARPEAARQRIKAISYRRSQRI